MCFWTRIRGSVLPSIIKFDICGDILVTRIYRKTLAFFCTCEVPAGSIMRRSDACLTSAECAMFQTELILYLQSFASDGLLESKGEISKGKQTHGLLLILSRELSERHKVVQSLS